jgi:hypothetical protein
MQVTIRKEDNNLAAYPSALERCSNFKDILERHLHLNRASARYYSPRRRLT